MNCCGLVTLNMFICIVTVVCFSLWSLPVYSRFIPTNIFGSERTTLPPGLPQIRGILGDPLKFSFEDQKLYLMKYNYLDQDSPNSKKSFERAIKQFQQFAGLRVTGKVNNETILRMLWPRCGVQDFHTTTRNKRWKEGLGNPWNRTQLTYKIINTPRNDFVIVAPFRNPEERTVAVGPSANRTQVKAAIRRAFKAWSKITNFKLEFREVKRKPDIRLKFVEDRHRNNKLFEGEIRPIAHAKYPDDGGNVYFDNTRAWGVDKQGRYGYDIFQTTVHELGHSLGLGHTDVKAAVMYPFYQFKRNWKFHSDDIDGINWLYAGLK